MAADALQPLQTRIEQLEARLTTRAAPRAAAPRSTAPDAPPKPVEPAFRITGAELRAGERFLSILSAEGGGLAQVRLLRPGEEVVTPMTSSSKVLHVIDGEGQVEIEGETFEWTTGDVVAVPTFTSMRLVNRSTTKPAFVFQSDDGPLQHKLGYYEEQPL